MGRRCLAFVLGLQLFFESSAEGAGKGLALFRGKTVQLPNTVKVPHMGWNTLNIVKPNELFDGIAEGSYVYFVHSLYPVPNRQIHSGARKPITAQPSLQQSPAKTSTAPSFTQKNQATSAYKS